MIKKLSEEMIEVFCMIGEEDVAVMIRNDGRTSRRLYTCRRCHATDGKSKLGQDVKAGPLSKLQCSL